MTATTAIQTYEFPDKVEYAILLLRQDCTSANTAKIYEHNVRRFLRWWRENPVYKTPAAAIDGWKHVLKGEGLNVSSINVMLSSVRKLFAIMAREGLVDVNDVASIKQVRNFPQKGTRVGTWLNEKEMIHLVKLPDTSTLAGLRDRALLAVAIACGLRASELCSLTWGHIRQVGDVWAIVNLRGKHGRMRTVPIATYVMRYLMEYRDELGVVSDADPVFIALSFGQYGKHLTRQSVYNLVRDYGEKLGKKLSPHDLRRSAAMLLYRKMGIEQTKQLLGHSSVTITERYLNTALDLSGVAKSMNLDVDGSAGEGE